MDVSLSAWLLVFAYGLAILALAVHFNKGDSDVRTVRKIVEQQKGYAEFIHKLAESAKEKAIEAHKLASAPKAPRPIEITIIKRSESNGIKKEDDSEETKSKNRTTKKHTTSIRQKMAR